MADNPTDAESLRADVRVLRERFPKSAISIVKLARSCSSGTASRQRQMRSERIASTDLPRCTWNCRKSVERQCSRTSMLCGWGLASLFEIHSKIEKTNVSPTSHPLRSASVCVGRLRSATNQDSWSEASKSSLEEHKCSGCKVGHLNVASCHHFL